jgi:hypothetical protein
VKKRKRQRKRQRENRNKNGVSESGSSEIGFPSARCEMASERERERERERLGEGVISVSFGYRGMKRMKNSLSSSKRENFVFIFFLVSFYIFCALSFFLYPSSLDRTFPKIPIAHQFYSTLLS